MTAFSLTARSPFPLPTEPFSGGLQIQVNGVDVGPPGPAILNIVQTGATGSYDSETGEVTVNLAAGGGGDAGFSPIVGTLRLSNDEYTFTLPAQFTSADDTDYIVSVYATNNGGESGRFVGVAMPYSLSEEIAGNFDVLFLLTPQSGGSAQCEIAATSFGTEELPATGELDYLTVFIVQIAETTPL
jgi:hypothetical protein